MNLRSLEQWWTGKACGPWTENKVWSRKWLLVLGVVLWALITDACGRPLADTTTSIIEWVVPPWLAIQGGIDFYRYRRERQAWGALAAQIVDESKKKGAKHE